MINILLVLPYSKKITLGGAERSILNIVNGLKKNRDFHVDYFYCSIHPLLQKTLVRLGFGHFILIPKIVYAIKKYKPDIIITQNRIAYAATIAAKLKKKPIINIVRDPSDFCPKFVDVINYGKACLKFENKNICYPCIDKWRTLRVLIGNKPKGWEYSLKAIMSTILYKIRYIFCKLNTILLNKAEIVLVASELMKSFLSFRVNHEKIKIINITPIKIRKIDLQSPKKNQFLFIIPSYEASHKGVDFILRLTRFIPDDYKMIIVGGIISNSRLDGILSKVINLGPVNSEDLDILYRNSKITLVPSFFTEAFGRVILESIVNGTPVITSPNCGANYFLQDKEFIKIVPLNLKLWLNQIRFFSNKSNLITPYEIKQIYNQFSVNKSVSEFSVLIKKVVSKE